MDDTTRVEPSVVSRLKWRCRRGLLENDLFIERFFRRYEETLTARQVEGLQLLMDLADNDLLDLLLARKDPRAPGHPGGAGCAGAVAPTRLMVLSEKGPDDDSLRRQSHPVVFRRQPQHGTADLQGHDRPDVIDIRKLYGQTGKFTYDPGFLSTASCNSPSPTSTATRASCCTAATRSSSWR
jgi:antitoxin CptB